jgi:hypothetical protein
MRKNISPDFVAKITLYSPDQRGRQSPIVGEWFGCPCKFHPNDFTAWDCRILTSEEKFSPGETKHFGLVFLTREIAPVFKQVAKFYLWEGRIIGEASADLSAA